MKLKRLTIGNRLYLSVLSLFLLFAVAFIVFQQYREKQYKISSLDLRLRGYNDQLHDAALSDGANVDAARVDSFLEKHPVRGVRVTVIRRDGTVLFDNIQKNYAAMGNHASRPEVAQALQNGYGSTVERNSSTVGNDYFYSATYYPSEQIVVRSALPYNVDLAKSLQTDQHYIWFALAVMLVLTIILYRFVNRLGRNITKLNEFAARADHGDTVDTDELMDFSDDELGDTAERIVKLYVKLQNTQSEQDRLKRQLTQNVAHELKTPVASIQGYLETILENKHIDDKTRQQFLERCYAQSQRLASLLGDMSTLNRMDDGASMMAFDKVDVAELIETVEKESQFRLNQKGMTMKLEIPASIPVRGNSELLYSIFRNLTDNAIAYAGMNTHIIICASLKGNRWHFTFSDDGVGVDAKHLPRLFERFYRVDKGRSRKLGGTGLGLAIVKNAVRVHGGNIMVRNNDGGGLCFDFTLRALDKE